MPCRSTTVRLQRLGWGAVTLAIQSILFCPAQAQTVTEDPSLGSQVQPGLGGFTISGGDLHGTNLFHSFDQFSPAEASVLFDLTDASYGNSGSGIERIFSRVTGGEASYINGTLGIWGGNQPDLFLLNPQGILFGPDAQLLLTGSFLGSTAEVIQFADGGLFPTALDGQGGESLLSVSAPTGLQLGQRSGAIAIQGPGHQRIPGDIRSLLTALQQPVEASGLRVAAGNTLALVGGEIDINGGILQAAPIFEPTFGLALGGIQLSLGGIKQGKIQLSPSAYGFELDYAAVEKYGDIQLSQRSLLDSTGVLPSRIELYGDNITIKDASLLTLNNVGNQPDPKGLTVSATGRLSLLSRDPTTPFMSAILNTALGPGNGANINLQADRLLVEGGGIASSTIGAVGGNSGDIDILAHSDISLKGVEADLNLAAFVSSAVISSSSVGTGDGGAIKIETPRLTLENGGLILSSAFGPSGNAQALDSGQGGNIQIQAREAVTIRGVDTRLGLASGISSSTFTPGDAGDISLSTQRLLIESGGSLRADSFSQGDSGSISVHATELVQLRDTSNRFTTAPSQISSGVLKVKRLLELNSLFQLPDRPQGNGGNVVINTPQLNVLDRTRLSVINEGAGNVGKLDVKANNILVDNQSQLLATSNTQPGELASEVSAKAADTVSAFNIDLKAAESLVLRNGSEISASALGIRNGGNIAIETQNLVAVPQENSDIRANSMSNFGGRIQLKANSVVGLKVQPQPTPKSDITASSALGNQFNGTVELTQARDQQNTPITTLPSQFSDPSDRLAQSCDAGSNQLTTTGRGSLPQTSHANYALSQHHGELGHRYEQNQQWHLAEQHSRQALQLSQSAQNPVQTYQWAWQLARIAQARWNQTGKTEFQAEAIAYYQESLNSLKELRHDLAQQDQRAELSFRTQIEPVYRELVSLLLSGDSQQQPTQDALKTSLTVIEVLRLAELDNFFEDACSIATTQSIEQLDPTAAVLYPIILGDCLEVIVSLPDGTLHHHSYPISAPRIAQLTQQFRQGLVTRSRRAFRKPGQQLYELLIQPFLADLTQAQIETLVLVPDGVFKNIPISALWTGDSYLIEEFNIATAPGLELLDAQPSPAIVNKSITAGISKAQSTSPPLLRVPQELEAIQELMPGKSILNEQFTEQALRQLLLEQSAPIVHIATHGQFSSEAEDTFILAWNERISSNQLGDLLRSREHSQAPIELLVLSACETAVGDEAAALGLAGIATRAGARSTLASLWSVGDASTSLLMQAFYTQLSQQKAGRSMALRQAQLAMIEDETYSHPYYWSAFTLLGNWQ